MESYIAVPVRLVEECPPDYRKVFWLVDAMSKAFLQRMEKEKLAGKELIQEYGVYVNACNELPLPSFPGIRFPKVSAGGPGAQKADESGHRLEALITALMGRWRMWNAVFSSGKRRGCLSGEKCGEKVE
ncbi:MAG: hypothetical protein ACLT8E_00995 [Akkermansia sp.]